MKTRGKKASRNFEPPKQKSLSGEKVPINKLKIQGLEKMIEYMPDANRQYYDTIIDWPTIEEELPKSYVDAETSGDED